MPSPLSAITVLYNTVRTAPPLNGWTGVQVLLGRRFMAKNGAPPRIVFFATEGDIKVARLMDNAIKDVDRVLVAHLWARDYDQMQELEARFFQALEYQAAPQPSLASPTLPAGAYWQATKETWETSSDTDSQGEEVYLTLVAICSIDRVPAGTGTVNATQLNPTLTHL